MTTSIQQQLPACRHTSLPIQTFLVCPTRTDTPDTCLPSTLVPCFGQLAWSLCFYPRGSDSACAGPPGAPMLPKFSSTERSSYATLQSIMGLPWSTLGIATNRRLVKAPQIRAATAAHIYNPLATAPHGPSASEQCVEAWLESCGDC